MWLCSSKSSYWTIEIFRSNPQIHLLTAWSRQTLRLASRCSCVTCETRRDRNRPNHFFSKQSASVLGAFWGCIRWSCWGPDCLRHPRSEGDVKTDWKGDRPYAWMLLYFFRSSLWQLPRYFQFHLLSGDDDPSRLVVADGPSSAGPSHCRRVTQKWTHVIQIANKKWDGMYANRFCLMIWMESEGCELGAQIIGLLTNIMHI